MGTKESQQPPQEVCGEAFDFIENACACPMGRDPHYVINMNQNPVYFSMHSKKALSKIGLKKVPILTSFFDTRHVTVVATITASSEKLLPMVIFKGSPTGTISRTEIPMFDPTSNYDLQKNVWMDERVMKHWVDEVLQPYIATAPDNVIPVLLLDSYHCHIMASIANKITSI